MSDDASSNSSLQGYFKFGKQGRKEGSVMGSRERSLQNSKREFRIRSVSNTQKQEELRSEKSMRNIPKG